MDAETSRPARQTSGHVDTDDLLPTVDGYERFLASGLTGPVERLGKAGSMVGPAAVTTPRCIVACHASTCPDGAMAVNDSPVELEALSEDFVVTPALARLLVKLARRHVEWESRQSDKTQSEENVA
ncbi:MAG: hypothetical protein WAV54_02630 [Acidimicrobiales bacterium]